MINGAQFRRVVFLELTVAVAVPSGESSASLAVEASRSQLSGAFTACHSQ
jgi:hypothetical protein